MKSFKILALFLVCIGINGIAFGQAKKSASNHRTILLWPNGAPGAKGTTPKDKPSITISKQGNTSVAKHKNAEDLLKEKNLKLLVKDGFSYGTYIDELIERHNPKRVVAVGSSNLQMLQMIMSGRADYFFVSEEEAEEIITSAGYSLQDFQRQRYTDMPPGNKRYIACSQRVTDEIVDRLNDVIE